MKGYGQFCPVAKAAKIVAERWTPLVLRELLCGSRRFSELQRGVPLMSRTLLAGRLKQLEDAGIVRSVARARGRGREYHLTAAGEELRPLIECLGEWGQRWARAQVGRDDLDPGLLMWDIHRRVNLDALSPERVVVRFDFRGVPATMRCARPRLPDLAQAERIRQRRARRGRSRRPPSIATHSVIACCPRPDHRAPGPHYVIHGGLTRPGPGATFGATRPSEGLSGAGVFPLLTQASITPE